MTGPRGVAPARLQCPAGCGHARLEQMLRSRERTVRFTGCKLARLKHDAGLIDAIRELAGDPEEDAYVRMEAAVALAETRTPTAFNLLRLVLEDQQQPLFLRSACAWGIGCHRTKEGAECLVRAFGDVAPEIREEALVALEDLGSAGLDSLLKGLSEESSDVAAGAAEALRRIRAVPVRDIAALRPAAAEVVRKQRPSRVCRLVVRLRDPGAASSAGDRELHSRSWRRQPRRLNRRIGENTKFLTLPEWPIEWVKAP